MRTDPFTRMSLAMALITPLLLAGCGDGGQVRGSVQIDQRGPALSAGTLDVIYGRYGANCTAHAAGTTWAIDTNGSSDLAVAIGNIDCQLAISQIDLKSGATVTHFVPTSGDMDLDPEGDYLSSAVPFKVKNTSGPVSFYLNAKLSAIGFGAPFSIELIHSDDPANTTSSVTPRMQVHEDALKMGNTPAPDYAIDFNGIATTAGPGSELYDVTGNAVAQEPGSLAGDGYVVLTDSMCPTDVDGTVMYYQANEISLAQTSDLNLSGSALGLVKHQDDPAVTGTTLPYTSCLLIGHCDGVNSCSLQTFQVTFRP